jgi:UDP-N-acetylmuramyl pentapeptide phosphotransferase/UDP-N-acetylglucosamine-1-phosphate transferase
MRAMPAQAIVLSFVVSLVCLLLLLCRFGRSALDTPNERSLHQQPVPRHGGIAILAGAATSLALGPLDLWAPLSLALILAVLSFADDLYGLPAVVRLAMHFAAALALVWYLLSPMNVAALLVLAIAVVWITNLYNFMDGADGVAGGMTVIGFGAYAAAAQLAGHAALASACAALAAAAAAFLLLNFYPARVFMGDVGSIPLGFLAAVFGLTGWRDDVWPLWFPLLVFAPFVGDATVTLLRRLARRDRVWQAHREHYYQRLVRMGFGHRGSALVGYAAMLLCALAALFGREQAPPVQAAVFIATCVLMAVLAVLVDLRWRRSPNRKEGAG